MSGEVDSWSGGVFVSHGDGGDGGDGGGLCYRMEKF